MSFKTINLWSPDTDTQKSSFLLLYPSFTLILAVRSRVELHISTWVWDHRYYIHKCLPITPKHNPDSLLTGNQEDDDNEISGHQEALALLYVTIQNLTPD